MGNRLPASGNYTDLALAYRRQPKLHHGGGSGKGLSGPWSH